MRLSHDLAVSREVLRDKLGEVSDTLCWPYGDFQDHIEVAREHGFRYLHTTHPFGRNVVGGDPNASTASRSATARRAGCASASPSHPLIAPLFNGFKARQKKMVPGP